MLHYTRFVDIGGSLLPEILDEVSPTSGVSGKSINLRVVGQEQNHTLLLVWDDVLPFSSPKKLVTFVGSYNPTNKTFLKLYTFETKVNIKQCSMSPDGVLLAYTTYSDENCCYSAFLAEIHNRMRTCIYSLNLEHDSRIQVKFLWPHRNINDADHLARESKLLVFLHHKSIGLYSINLRRTGASMVLHKLPVAEQVCGRFIWAQWDKLSQRLYVLTNKTKNGKTRNTFKCLEFGQAGKIPSSPVMMMELPFNIKEHHYTERSGCDVDPLSDIISGNSLNMQVITQSQGVFCICYQNVLLKSRRIKKTISSPNLGSRAGRSLRPSASGSRVSVPDFSSELSHNRRDISIPQAIPMSPTDVKLDLMGSAEGQRRAVHVDVAYSIYCVHNGHLISARAHQVPQAQARGMKLFFGPQDGYVLVYSPGIMQHLVNATPDFSPCHHLAISPAAQLDGQGGAEGSNANRLGLMSCEQSSRTGTCVYDIKNQVAYQYTWMRPLPYASLHNGLANSLLHRVVVQSRDNQSREEIMSHLTRDPTDPELWQYFLEFIISSTYAAVRKQVEDRDILQNFPYTTEVAGPQLVMTAGGEKIATFESTSCASKVDISDEATQNRGKLSYPVGNPYLFHRLKGHVAEMKENKESERYTTKSLRAKIDTLQEEKMLDTVPASSKEFQRTPPTPNSTLKWATESVRKKLVIPGRRRRKSPTPTAMETTAVQAVQSEEDWRYDRIKDTHVEVLHEHLQKRLTHMSSEKLLQIATTYCDCQIQQVEHLINILIRSSGLDDKSAPSVWDTSLNTRGSDQEQHLFMLMERLYVALERHCLQSPKDFQTHFTCLGFRCLDLPTFLDYLQNEVLQLTKTFLLKLIKDLPDDAKINRAIKLKLFNLLSQKNQAVANEILVSWNHPQGNAALTKVYLEQIWFSETLKAASKDSEQPESPSATFPPLVSLLKYTQRFGKDTNATAKQGLWMPSSKIASAAIFNTVEKYGDDLRGFSF